MPYSTQQFSVTGIILAGGAGSRMHGQDKGWLKVNNTPFIELVIKRLSPQVDRLFISANRNIERYQELGLPVFQDQDQDQNEPFQGPLAGMLAGLASMDTEYACFVPVDAPFLPQNLLDVLKSHAGDKPNLVLLNVNNRLQPLFGLYHKSLLASMKAYFETGKRKLITWCEAQQPTIVDWPGDSDGFTNINTPDDLAQINQPHHIDNPQ